MICDECETVAHCLKNGCVPKTTKQTEAMKLALEALEYTPTLSPAVEELCDATITAIKQALAAPVQEPWPEEPFGYFQYDIRLDAWVQNRINNKGAAFYTTPPAAVKQDLTTAPAAQRQWVGLTDEEAFQICVDCGCLSEDWLILLDAIEAKLQEKNL